MKWQVRRLYPGKDYPWAVTAAGWGIQPRRTWQDAMDYANDRARRELEWQRDQDIARENGWPKLAGVEFPW